MKNLKIKSGVWYREVYGVSLAHHVKDGESYYCGKLIPKNTDLVEIDRVKFPSGKACAICDTLGD